MRFAIALLFLLLVSVPVSAAPECDDWAPGYGNEDYRVKARKVTPSEEEGIQLNCPSIPMSFTAAGSDVDVCGDPITANDTVTYQWRVFDETNFEEVAITQPGSQATYTFTFTTPGFYSVTCTVRDLPNSTSQDDLNQFGEAGVTWDVVVLEPGDILNPPTRACVGEEISFQGSSEPSGWEENTKKPLRWFVDNTDTGKTGATFDWTFEEPGQHTVTFKICEAASDPVTVNVVLVDLEVDSNNDGVIRKASDEPVEEALPGKILGRDGPAAPVKISVQPTGLTDYTVVLSGTGGIAVWQNANKTGPVSLPASYTPGTVPSTLYVSGTSVGSATLTLNILSAGTSICPDWVQLVVYDIPDAKLQDVEYHSANTNNFPVFVDGTTTPYATPHWHDANLDGDALDPGENQSPTCYKRNNLMIWESKLKVSAVLKITGDPSLWPATVQIKGDGPGNLDIAPTPANRSGNTITLPATESSGTFADSVHWMNPLTISWFVSTDNGVTWKYVGTNANEVFVVLGTPPSTKLWRTAAKLATQNGGRDADSCLANTWKSFEGPANVKKWSDTTRDYTIPLHYYLYPAVATGPFDPVTLQTTAMELLKDGNGQCHSWAELFKDCLLINNVANVKKTFVLPYMGYNGFAVKNIAFDALPEYPDDDPWKYSSLDLDDYPPPDEAKGLPGQNRNNDNPPRQKKFDLHFIVHREGDATYYDPSYGVTTTGPVEYTTANIDAWKVVWVDDSFHWRRSLILEPEQLEFVDVAW